MHSQKVLWSHMHEASQSSLNWLVQPLPDGDLTCLYCVSQTPQTKRHLLRWWVHSDANDRPIAPTFAPRSSVQPEEASGMTLTPSFACPSFPTDGMTARARAHTE